MTVLINSLPAARVLDNTAHAGYWSTLSSIPWQSHPVGRRRWRGRSPEPPAGSRSEPSPRTAVWSDRPRAG